MAKNADTQSQNLKAAQALTMAGTSYDDLVEAITAIVDQVTGQVQAQVANSIAPSLAGKQRIIDVLNQILPQVPAQAQPIIASIIAALSAGDATEVVNLNDAATSGALPVDISAIVTQCLDMATALIDDAFGMIQSLLPMLPDGRSGPAVAQVLNIVNSIVGTIVPTVLSTVTGPHRHDPGLAAVRRRHVGLGRWRLRPRRPARWHPRRRQHGRPRWHRPACSTACSAASSAAARAAPAAGVGGIMGTVTGLLEQPPRRPAGGGGLVPST